MKKLITFLFFMALLKVVNAAPPTITSFSPTKGVVGATVTITGTNFSTIPANNIVFFGATKATVSAASATSLTVTVPSGATCAPITVLNTETILATYSLSDFIPVYSPNKGSIFTSDFASSVYSTTDISPFSGTIGDLDGDGKTDIVVANGSSTISVLLNTSSSGSISFATKADFTVGTNPKGIVLGDIDGDGKLDIIVPNMTSNTVSILRNTSTVGSISFVAKADFGTGGLSIGIAIGDMDGDGKPDIIVPNNGTTVSVLRNTSNGSTINFATKVDYTTGSGPSSVTIGDIDGDGKPDIIVGNNGSNTVSVFRNTCSSGTISFDAKVDFATGAGPQRVTIGDIDGDGKPDLAIANTIANTISVLHNTSNSGSISFDTKVDLITGNTPTGVSIGDIDGDGKPDLAVSNYSSNSVSVFRNTSSSGSVSFSSKVDFSAGTNPRCISIGDIDGDGKPDLVLVNEGTNNVSVLRNTQTSNRWTGATNTAWETTSNWSANAIPISTDNATIPNVTNKPEVNQDSGSPAICNNLTIESGSSLTINAGKALSVSGSVTNNATGGVVIKSTSSGTGSLLINGSVSGTGSATAECYITTGAWHYLSSPLSGQTVANFLTSNANIATSGSNRGMMDYYTSGNRWNSFFTDGTGNGNLETTKGFAMRINANGTVTFTGSVQAGTLSTALSTGWNCIGNPYTSAIGLVSGTTAANNFLTVNTSSFNSSYAAIYIWDKDDSHNNTSGQYRVINNTIHDYIDVQQGQAFMVNSKTGGAIFNFTNAMQIHSPATTIKSAKIPWPSIKLIATVDNEKSSTLIAFNSAMTKGLDPTYDAGLLKGSSDLIVYSKLIEDNGISFAIQALPDNDYANMIIPIGIDFNTGGEVTFSSELMNLPANCRAILEDKLSKTFTDLSANIYKTTIASNSSIIDRFFLHTSNSSGTDQLVPDKLTAFANRNVEILLKGAVSNVAEATLFDIRGRIVLARKLVEGNFNIIPTPNLKTGIYLLSVKDKGKLDGFKIMVNE